MHDTPARKYIPASQIFLWSIMIVSGDTNRKQNVKWYLSFKFWYCNFNAGVICPRCLW